MIPDKYRAVTCTHTVTGADLAITYIAGMTEAQRLSFVAAGLPADVAVQRARAMVLEWLDRADAMPAVLAVVHDGLDCARGPRCPQ